MVNRLYIFPIALIIAILDQISKYLVSSRLILGEKITIIHNILSMTKIYNTGAAFSLFQENTGLLAGFSFLVTIAISFYFIKKFKNIPVITTIGWGLILGGTVGNLIDRVRLGYVIDFVKLDFVNFPVFNIADFSINIGAFLLIIYTFILTNSKVESK